MQDGERQKADAADQHDDEQHDAPVGRRGGDKGDRARRRMGYAEHQHQRDGEPDRHRRHLPQPRKGQRCRNADQRRDKIAGKDIGGLGQRARRLAEHEYGGRAERRDQHGNASEGSQATNRGHADHRARPRLQVRDEVPLGLMAGGEGANVAAQRRSPTKGPSG